MNGKTYSVLSVNGDGEGGVWAEGLAGAPVTRELDVERAFARDFLAQLLESGVELVVDQLVLIIFGAVALLVVLGLGAALWVVELTDPLLGAVAGVSVRVSSDVREDGGEAEKEGRGVHLC